MPHISESELEQLKQLINDDVDLSSFFDKDVPTVADVELLSESYPYFLLDSDEEIIGSDCAPPLLLAVVQGSLNHLRVCLPLFIGYWDSAKKNHDSVNSGFYETNAARAIKLALSNPSLLSYLLEHQEFSEIYEKDKLLYEQPHDEEEDVDVDEMIDSAPTLEEIILNNAKDLSYFFSSPPTDEHYSKLTEYYDLTWVSICNGQPLAHTERMTPLIIALRLGKEEHFLFLAERASNPHLLYDPAFIGWAEHFLSMRPSMIIEKYLGLFKQQEDLSLHPLMSNTSLNIHEIEQSNNFRI